MDSEVSAQGPGKVQSHCLKVLWTLAFHKPYELRPVGLGQPGVHSGHPMGPIPQVGTLHPNSTCTVQGSLFSRRVSQRIIFLGWGFGIAYQKVIAIVRYRFGVP